MQAIVARDRERFTRETRTYDAPVEWFSAVLEPDTDDPEALAAAVGGEPGVVSAQVRRRQRRREQETWLVVRVAARSRDEAAMTAHEAVMRHVWPDARLAGLPDGAFAVSAGRAGFEATGLAAYEEDVLG
jgi:hypothetical protein